MFSSKFSIKSFFKEKFDLDYPSFSHILPYRYFDPTCDLFINENSFGFGFEIASLAGADEKVINSLADAIRFKVPDDVEVQFVLWGNNKVGHQLDKISLMQDSLGGMYSKLAQISNKFYKSALTKGFKNKRNLPLKLRDYRCFCFVSKKTKYSQEAIRSIVSLREDLSSEFSAAEISHIRLSIESFIRILHDWLNVDNDNIYPSAIKYNNLEQINSQLVDPSFELITHPDCLEIESQSDLTQKRAKATLINLSVRNLPDEFSLWMGADNFCNVFRATQSIECPFLLSMHFKLMPHANAKSRANRKYFDLDKKANSVFAKIIPGTTKAAAEWKKIRDDLAADEIRLAKTFTNLVLFSNEKDKKQDEALAIGCFRFNGTELYNIKYLQLQSYLATLPFVISEGLYNDLAVMGRLKTLTSWNLANMLPLVADYKCGQSGLVIPTFRNQLACLDPFDQNLPVDNYNIAVAASSGAGKSFLIQALMMQVLSQHGKVWVIDIGNSYKKFCKTVGGSYLNYSNLSLNPFSHIRDIQESCEKIRDLFAVLASPKAGLSDVQKSHLLDAVLDAWDKKQNTAKIDDVVFYLEKISATKPDLRVDDIVTLLKKYTTTGKNSRFFNDYSALAPDAKFVVLELGELEDQPDLMKAVLFALILNIEEQMYQSSRSLPKMCVIDEAWRLLSGSNDEAASFIEQGFRTARKHLGSFVTITQSVKDYHLSPESQACWNNSDFKIIMRQNAKAFDDFVLEKPDYYSAYEQTLIKGFGPAKENGFSEFMLCIGSVTSFNRLFVDPFSRIMYSSAGNEYEAVENYCKSGMKIEDAIYQVAYENYAQELKGLNI